MAALTYGDLASKTYGDLQNLTYSFEVSGNSGGGTTTSLSQEDIAAIAAAVWDYTTKEVTVEATQAASFVTATGFATPANVTTALNGVAQESSLTAINTLLQTSIALLSDFSVSGSTLTITVNNTNKTYTITKSDGSITGVHPTQQQ